MNHFLNCFKGLLVTILFLQAGVVLKGQNNSVYVSGDAVIDSVFEASMHEIIWTPDALMRSLPSSVDNSTLLEGYMPPIINQDSSSSCVQCAEIGYVFTYEQNRYRNLSAGSHWYNGTDIQMQNLYPPFFTYNFLNDGNGLKYTNYGDGFKILAENGCPTLVDYYNPVIVPPYYPSTNQLPFRYWMSGSDKYILATENNITYNHNVTPYKITWYGNTYGSLDNLKRWLVTHNTRDGIGGLAIISVYMPVGPCHHTIPTGSPHSGEYIITSWASDGGHALTIVGYDDDVWVSSNPVQPTASTPLANCEKGAFKVANSWGTDWGNQGYVWVPYKLFASGQLQYNYRAYTCIASSPKEKTVFLCATVAHPNRRKMTIQVGKGLCTTNLDPDSTKTYNIFNYQGGPDNGLMIPMNGDVNNPAPIELALNFGEKFDLADCGKYFFQVVDNYQGTNNYLSEEAYITNYRLKDFRWNEEFSLDCEEGTVPIQKHATTSLTINYHLLPFENAIETNFTMGTDRVARRTVTVSGGTFSIGNGVKLDMYGTDDYDCELLFGSNASLVIGDSAVITAKRGDCRIEINGNVQIGKNVRFEAEDGASLEIVIDNGLDVSFNKTTFVNCDLTLPEKNILLNACQFLGTPVSIERNATGGNNTTTATVLGCVFRPNGNNIPKALYIKGYAQYSVENCIISNADLTGGFADGIYIHSSGTANTKTINGNEISNCTGAGIIMYASAGNITMNHIYDNGYGVRLLNNSNIGQFSGDCSAGLAIKTQYIHDNAGREVYMTGGCIPQTFRYNSIGDDDDVPFVYFDALIGFVYPSQRVSIDVAYNHWSPNFDSNTHLVTNSNLWYYVSSPQWVLGDCGPKTSNAENMIASADSLVSIGNHVSAKALYKQVIADYPTTVSAETALKSLLMIERYADNDYEGLKEYYQTHPAILGDESLSHMAFSLSNKCDEIQENYEEAIAWYEGVLTDPETGFNDSIFAAIDLGDLYLRMETNGAKGVCGKLKEFIPESKEAHREQTELALSLLPKEVASNTIEQKHRDLPEQLWTDIVTEQPDGYVVDENGNVHIYTAEAMAWLISLTNGLNGQEINNFDGRTISLENDIDLSSARWLPIAGFPIAENQFKGVLDGKGHVIEGLLMTNAPSYYYSMGLFGEVSGGILKNIIMKDGYYENTSGGDSEGGFLAYAVRHSTVEHCFVDCELHIEQGMSPFVYLCDSSTISNCLVHSPIYHSESWSYNIPGILVAYSYPTSYICNCVSIIDRMDYSEHCGLVGLGNYGKIENCYAYIGEFIDFGGAGGGLAPRNGITACNYESGEIYNCYFNRVRNFVGSSYYIPLDYSPASENAGVIQNSVSFAEEGRGRWKLSEVLSFELENGTVTTDDLLEALNFKVELLNNPELLDWCDVAIGFDNQQLPVFCGVNIAETDEHLSITDSLMLYPNPTNGIVWVDGVEVSEIQIYNVMGQLLKSYRGIHKINVSDLPRGIYLLHITDCHGVISKKKIVVE